MNIELRVNEEDNVYEVVGVLPPTPFDEALNVNERREVLARLHMTHLIGSGPLAKEERVQYAEVLRQLASIFELME